MEVAVLTAELRAEIAGFQANLRAADRTVEDLRRDIVALEASAAGLGPALDQIRITQMQAAESRAALHSMKNELDSMRNAVMENKAALMEMGISEGQVAKFTAATAVMSEDLDRVGDEAARARREIESLDIAQRRVGVGPGRPGVFGSGRQFVGGQPPSYVRGVTPTPQELADYNFAQYLASQPSGGPLREYERYRQQLLDSQRAPNGALMMGPGSSLREVGMFGTDEVSRGPFASRATFPFTEADQVARDAERLVSRGERRGGGGGRGNYNFLTGLLPGGRRAGAGAVTTGIGLAAAASPALLPAAAGLAAGAAAGLEGLVGGAATLKLAFADLSAAAFTNKKKFDELTPAQQQFVMTLKTIDQGFLKPLERLAQSSVLPGLTAALHSALTPASIGAARGAVSGFGNAISGGAQQLGGLFGSTGFASAFGSVMATDAVVLRDFLGGLTHLIDAFVHLQQAAGPLVLWLDKGALAFTVWIDNTVKAQQASGGLARFFDEAKTSLQALGGLVASVAGALHSLLQAFGGFSTAISVIKLLSDVFATIGQFLNRNRTLLRDFFSGALQSARDILGVVKGLLTAFQPFLNMLEQLSGLIKSVTGGVNIFRLAIDATAIVLTAKLIPGLLGIGPAAATGTGEGVVAMTAMNTEATVALGTVSALRLALIGLILAPEAYSAGKSLGQWLFGSPNNGGFGAGNAQTGVDTDASGWPVGPNGKRIPIGGVPYGGSDTSAAGMAHPHRLTGKRVGPGGVVYDVGGTGNGAGAGAGYGVVTSGNFASSVSQGVGDVPASWINQAAAATGVPPALIAAEIMQESGGHWSVNASGHIGYGQFDAGTAKGLGINPYNKQQNVKGIGVYLAKLYQQYGSVEKAIAAYYGGSYGARVVGTPAGNKPQGANGQYPSVNDYVMSVMAQAGDPTTFGVAGMGGNAFNAGATGFDATTGNKPSRLDQVLPPHLQQALAAAKTNMESAQTALASAQPGRDQLKASQDLLRSQKEYDAQLERSMAHLRSITETGKLRTTQLNEEALLQGRITALTKQEAQTRQDIAAAAFDIKGERILGLGVGGGPQTPGAHVLMARERAMLLKTATAAGLDTSRFQHESLNRVIADMQKQGFHFPQSTLTSLHKVNEILEHIPKGTKPGQIPDLLTNIRDRLGQIHTTLLQDQKHAYASNYVPIGDITGGLNLTRAQRIALREAQAQSQAHHGMRPSGYAVDGIALNSQGQPFSHPTHSTHQTVHINIYDARDPKKLAEEIRHILLRMADRSSVQSRGPAAMLRVGLR